MRGCQLYGGVLWSESTHIFPDSHFKGLPSLSLLSFYAKTWFLGLQNNRNWKNPFNLNIGTKLSAPSTGNPCFGLVFVLLLGEGVPPFVWHSFLCRFCLCSLHLCKAEKWQKSPKTVLQSDFLTCFWISVHLLSRYLGDEIYRIILCFINLIFLTWHICHIDS